MSIEVYTYPFSEFPDVLRRCLADATLRILAEIPRIPDAINVVVSPKPVDVRMWVQKWKTSGCGFDDVLDEPQVTLAPTVIIKYHHTLRYVFHNGRFAYALRGQTSIEYYNRCVTRSFPGASDRGAISYLTA